MVRDQVTSIRRLLSWDWSTADVRMRLRWTVRSELELALLIRIRTVSLCGASRPLLLLNETGLVLLLENILVSVCGVILVE